VRWQLAMSERLAAPRPMPAINRAVSPGPQSFSDRSQAASVVVSRAALFERRALRVSITRVPEPLKPT
jgi:hypothetical protein